MIGDSDMSSVEESDGGVSSVSVPSVSISVQEVVVSSSSSVAIEIAPVDEVESSSDVIVVDQVSSHSDVASVDASLQESVSSIYVAEGRFSVGFELSSSAVVAELVEKRDTRIQKIRLKKSSKLSKIEDAAVRKMSAIQRRYEKKCAIQHKANNNILKLAR